MEIQQARGFVAVAEELHFGRASDRLRLTKSALSRSVAQLERSLGSKLVERTTRSVELTPAGEALLPHAREIRSRLPGLRLELESSTLSHRGLDQILEGSLDIALGCWDLLPAEVASRVVTREELVLAASGFGVAMTQSSVQEHIYAPGVVFRPIAESPPPLPVRLVWRREEPSPALAEVIDVAGALYPVPALRRIGAETETLTRETLCRNIPQTC